MVALLEAMADKWVWTLACGQNKNLSSDQVKVWAININAKFFAREHWVKGVGTFIVVLYHNQRPVNLFAFCYIAYYVSILGTHVSLSGSFVIQTWSYVSLSI